MIKLFQIRISREEARDVNDGLTVPKYKAHCDAICFGTFTSRDFYDHVADIDTDDLDMAFQTGNIGPESSITRHAPMHSVSVGDVLVTKSGDAFIVASFGFNKLTFEQSRSFAF